MSRHTADYSIAASPDLRPEAEDPRRVSVHSIIAITAALAALGLVMVFSAGSVRAVRFGSPWFFLVRQAIWLAIGMAGLAVAWRVDYRRLARWWPYVAGAVAAALFLVLVIGHRFNGARRWIVVGGQAMQFSEMAKLGLVLVLAAWIARGPDLGDFRRRLLPAVGFIGVLALLIFAEPDLGTAALIGMVGFSMLIVGGARLRYFLPIVLAVLPVLAAVAWWKFDHFSARINEFFNAPGWQAGSALTAIGNGGVFGVGLGNGAMKNMFVPEEATDFILAAIGEELGLLGGLAVVALFIAFVYHGMRITNLAEDTLGAMIAFGVTLVIGLQAAVNIAVVTRCLPPKGIALPFVSYGGSSLLFFMISVGLLLNVARSRKPAAQAEPAGAPAPDAPAAEPGAGMKRSA